MTSVGYCNYFKINKNEIICISVSSYIHFKNKTNFSLEFIILKFKLMIKCKDLIVVLFHYYGTITINIRITIKIIH